MYRIKKNSSDMKFTACFYSTFVFLTVAVVHVCSQTEAEPNCVQNEESQSFNNWVLKILNEVRNNRSHSDLKIEENLVENSTEWSRQLAENGEQKYSEDDDSAYGEIVFNNPKMFLNEGSALEQIQKWYKENEKYLWAVTVDNSTGDNRYPKLLWEQTRKIGCGACSGYNGTFLTCRYTPKGGTEDIDVPNQGRNLDEDSDTSESNLHSFNEPNNLILKDEEDNEEITSSKPKTQITTSNSKTTRTENDDALKNEQNNEQTTTPDSTTTNTKDHDEFRNEKNEEFSSPRPTKQITSSVRTTNSNQQNFNEENPVTSAPDGGMISKTALISAFILTVGVLIFSSLLLIILGVLLYNQTRNYYYCTLN